MRFSVIIPVYNRAGTVCDAIDSVFDQSLEDFEVIVVDDGSTDETAKTVKEQYGSEVQLIRQENKGPGAARNRGIEAARGEYVTFLDSDDVWFPWTLAVFGRAIRRNKPVSFVAGTHEEATSRKSRRPQLETGLDDYEDQWWPDYYTAAENRPLWIGMPAVAIRLDVLRSVGRFPTARTNAEDSELWMRLGTASGFVRVREPSVFAYRRGQDSQVRDLHKTFRGLKKMIERERQGEYPGGDSRRIQRYKVLTRHTRAASLSLARAGHFEQACFLYKKTIWWNWRLRRLKYLVGAPLVGFAELARSS